MPFKNALFEKQTELSNNINNSSKQYACTTNNQIAAADEKGVSWTCVRAPFKERGRKRALPQEAQRSY